MPRTLTSISEITKPMGRTIKMTGETQQKENKRKRKKEKAKKKEKKEKAKKKEKSDP